MVPKISFEWPFLRQRALVVMDMRERGVGATGSRRFWLAAFGRKRDVIRAAALCHTAALIDAHVVTPELHLFFKWERVAIGSRLGRRPPHEMEEDGCVGSARRGCAIIY
jgi:hypothetical protein